MELIYADSNQIDIGVITDFSFDLSFGDDENNFEFSMPLDAHCCKEGYFLYVEGTEMGGIIDTIKVDTSADTVSYCGRTWHGILANAVLVPDAGFDYYTVDGDGNEVLKEIILRLGLSDIFAWRDYISPIEVRGYSFDRYIDAYKGIRKMLAEFGGKLKMTHEGSKVYLEVDWIADYAKDETWDSSQLSFKLERAYRPCNHLICLGSGDLAKRHVIHLFTDENGGIQPYAKTDNPLQDSDYILTTEHQKLFGKDEVCQTYDYGGANTAENYVLVTEQPKNWRRVYPNYFIHTEDGDYENPEAEEVENDSYKALTSKPSDWATKYGNYYYKKGSGYYNVEAVVKEATYKYTELKKEPKDWKKTYRQYYQYKSDGLTYTYEAVKADSSYKYELQTMQPSDWLTNYYRYYETKKSGGYKQIDKVEEGKKTPKWKKKTYYTAVRTSKCPNFAKNVKAGVRYFIKSVKTKETASAPTFEANKYYWHDDSVTTILPAWASDTYYKLVYDNYAELVQGGIEQLEELWQAESLDLNLSNKLEYDIGDIVGAKDQVTGIEVIKAISQKNIVISSDEITIKYKVGG